MLISQYDVFDKPDNARPPSIHYTLFDPPTDWAEDELTALAAGSIVVQVNALGDRNTPDLEMLGVWVKRYPTPTTNGYDGSADYMPLGHRLFMGVSAPNSATALFKRQPLGAIYLQDGNNDGSPETAWLKIFDTGSNSGCTDWTQIPLYKCNDAIMVGGTSNDATGNYAATLGGSGNTASGTSSAVVGGGTNTASGAQAVAIGGRGNTATGQDAVAIGGRWHNANNTAAVGIGQKTNITHANAVLINTMSGASYDADADLFDSAASGEFAVRAGSYRLFTNLAESAGVSMAGGASSWSAVSDERTKADILEVEDDALDGYRRLRVVSYVQGEDNIGAGITAQDFYACFPFLHVHQVGKMLAISQAERDGVQDLAIKQMLATVDLLVKENQGLRNRIARLEGVVYANQ